MGRFIRIWVPRLLVDLVVSERSDVLKIRVIRWTLRAAGRHVPLLVVRDAAWLRGNRSQNRDEQVNSKNEKQAKLPFSSLR